MDKNICEKAVTEEKIGYRQVFTQKEYCKIIFANLISRFGDSIDAVAFTWLVYAVTQSASWTAVISACNMLPTMLLQPFAGAAVEHRNKKKIMIVSDVIRGLVVIALAFCYVTDRMNPWVMLVFTLTISSVEAFCMPASTAIIPKILDEKYYEYGMSLNSVGSTVMQLVGTGAAGVIIGICGVHIAIAIDAVTFFAAAVVKMFLKVKEDVSVETSRACDSDMKTVVNHYMEDLKEGISYVKENRILVNLGLLGFLANGMLVPVNCFLTPLVSDVLKQGSELLSVISMAITVGSIAGSVFYPMLIRHMSVKRYVFATGFIMSVSIMFLPIGSMFADKAVLVYVVTGGIGLLLGLCASLLGALFNVQFMKNTEEDYMARANAIFSAFVTAAMPILSFLMSGVVKFIAVKELITTSGIFCAIIFSVFYVLNIQFSEENAA